MPSSLQSSTRRRISSNLEQRFSRSESIEHSPIEKYLSRSFSIHSISPPTPVREHFAAEDGSNGVSISDPDGALDDSNGLGNLADELAEAWDDRVQHGRDNEHLLVRDRLLNGHEVQRGRPTFKIHHSFSNRTPSMYQCEGNVDGSLSPPKQSIRTRPQRKTSNVSEYDGSDHGDPSDLETVEGISASLEYRLAAIGSLARRGIESNGSGADSVFTRVVECLQNLGPQAGMETGTSRLTTAHTAVSINLGHQARLVQTLSHHFISPFSEPPASGEIDDLLPLLTTTPELLSQPNTRAVSALRGVYSSSLDLISTLSMLADSLHMMRQTTSRASRKLKAAKEAVDDVRKDHQVMEDGIRWIQEGNWDEKLSNRECANVCGLMLNGFKEACETWEKRIDERATDHRLLEMAAG
ncbi:MAG: hypothetical protein LQ352_000274 [Teloschistes flavicans]|nr:MAG: hypothetical protein LQ352_000274 [Teloschistes flavicans]